MSFFFQKTGQKVRQPKEPVEAAKPIGAQAKAAGVALRRLGCKACPLNRAPVHAPKMVPRVPKTPLIYFLGEAPGKDEDEQSGSPFTGPSGSLLRECIPDGMAQYCAFDNIINCRPPNNRTPAFTEIQCCTPRRELFIEQAKPKLIVGVGYIPTQWALGSVDMSGIRGRLFAVKVGNHTCWFLPTYHPSFILRIAHNKRQPLRSRLGHCFRMDIQRAFALLEGLDPPIIDEDVRGGITRYDGEDFDGLISALRVARRQPVKCVDLETKGLRPYSNGALLVSAAISHGNTNFAFSIDHPKAQWSIPQRNKILEEFGLLVSDDTIKVAHNVPFELEWLIWAYGPQVVDHAAWECTQVQAHILDERRGKKDASGEERKAPYQTLAFLVKQHLGVTYKSAFKLNKKDMTKSDLGEILIYNGADTKHTLRLWHHQNKLLKQQGLYDAYLEAVPRQPTVALMQTIGAPVDQAALQEAKGELEPEIEDLEAEINDLDVVKNYIKDREVFNPGSQRDVVVIFRDYLKYKVTEGERTSVDKNVLDTIEHPLADLIVQLRNRSKMKSTYIDGLEAGKGGIIFPDGLLHTNFNTTYTETGRLSSDEPNLQNYPKRNDLWIRRPIVPPKGHVMVAVDYGQLEACTGAMCSKDKYLVKALWEDYDIHHEWGVKIATKLPALVDNKLNDKKIMGKFRSLVKNKMVFPAFFGATNESVCAYLIGATGHHIDQPVIDDIMDEFWATFDGMRSWQEQLMRKYYDIGYVETLTGRRHRYPLTRNQAINMPVQGTAADLVCDAMVRLSHLSLTTGKPYLHPVLNIHDDLTFFIPEKVLDTTLETIIREMLTFSYDWVNVPLSVEVSIGPNWADLDPIGKFWSHKDV